MIEKLVYSCIVSDTYLLGTGNKIDYVWYWV